MQMWAAACICLTSARVAAMQWQGHRQAQPMVQQCSELRCTSAAPQSSRCAALRCAGDNLVNIRASSRAEPEGRLGSGGQLSLSLREGFVINRWAGGRQMVPRAAGAQVQ